MRIKARWERTIQVAQFSLERLELEVERELNDDQCARYADLVEDLSKALTRKGDKLVRERMIHHGLISASASTGPTEPDEYTR